MKKFFLFLLMAFISLNAQSIQVGSNITLLNNYKYETPKSRQMKVPLNTKTVIIAYEKDTGKLVNDFLSKKNKYFLQRNKAIYIADIHKMPTVITNMFALPNLRKFKHLIYLHYGDKFEKIAPKQNAKISVVTFENKKVKTISFISSTEELSKIF